MIYEIDPLQDSRWPDLLESSPRSSVFHSIAWLEALRRTYGYLPIAYTTSAPASQLHDAVVACRIESWITGGRLVSLPFSDHCEPLAEDAAHADALVAELTQRIQPEKLRYLEVRGAERFSACHPGDSYCLHRIDLRPDLAALFGNCHKSSTQRKIRRAGREALRCETGRSDTLLATFYRLLVLTRRRHGVPPQPKRWFRNLIECFGEALQIRVAWKGQIPVASILTLRHKDTMVYKYGCSDSRFHNLGGTHLLFWKTIEESKAAGLERFDLGRTEWDDAGLLRFKDRWGSVRSSLTYSRFSASPAAQPFRASGVSPMRRVANAIVPHLPCSLLRIAGSALYRHVG